MSVGEAGGYNTVASPVWPNKETGGQSGDGRVEDVEVLQESGQNGKD